MADNYKAILQELCGTALNIPAGELQTLLTKSDDELDALPEEVTAIKEKVKGKYREVITSLNKTAQLEGDKKFKAGQRTKAEEIEKELREKFGVDESDKTGSDLLDEIVTSISEASKKKGGDKITEDDIKKHPYYLSKEAEFKKQVKQANDDKAKEVDTLKAEFQRKEIFSEVKKAGLNVFDGMNPILSDDPKKAAMQREDFANKLDQYEWQKVEDKFIPMVDKKVVQDEFGHTVDFDKLVKDLGNKYYDFKVAEERKAPPGEKKPGDQGYKPPTDPTKKPYTGKLPKTEAEWKTMQADPSIPIADKLAINDHWKSTQPAT